MCADAHTGQNSPQQSHKIREFLASTIDKADGKTVSLSCEPSLQHLSPSALFGRFGQLVLRAGHVFRPSVLELKRRPGLPGIQLVLWRVQLLLSTWLSFPLNTSSPATITTSLNHRLSSLYIPFTGHCLTSLTLSIFFSSLLTFPFLTMVCIIVQSPCRVLLRIPHFAGQID